MAKSVPVSLYKHPEEDSGLYISLTILFILVFVVSVISIGSILVLLIIGFIYIRLHQGQILGNSVLVTAKNFPQIDKFVDLACERLGEKRPRVHILEDPHLNAFAIGFSHPFSIVLHSTMIKHLTDNELLFIIGHELAHIKCRHTFWLSIIAPFGNYLPGLNLIFSFWSRKAEYTCDRAGLVVCQDLDAAIRAILKISVGPELVKNIDLDELFNQTKVIEKNYLDKFGEVLGTHPYSVNRIKNLVDFSRSKAYLEIVYGIHSGEEGNIKKKCPACNNIYNPTYKFCLQCGSELEDIKVENSCRRCGKILEDNYKFCPVCGEMLEI